MRLSISFARPLSCAALALSFLATGELGAQCPTGTTIPNFRYVNGTSTTPRQITYAWDAPAGSPAGLVYEVLRSTATDYCAAPSPFAVVAETTSNTQTVTLDTTDLVYQFLVRVKSCTQVTTGGTWVDDSFLTPPSAPVISAVASGSGQVAVTLAQPDARAAAQVLERAGSDGVFGVANISYFYNFCPAGSSRTYQDGGLAAGTYSYRAYSLNQGTSQQRVYSPVVTLTIGGGTCFVGCSAVVPAAGPVASPMVFHATSSATGCSGSPTVAWNFGDNVTSTLADAVHAYAAPGVYSWSLTVSLEGAASCIRTGIITIANTPPVVSFFTAANAVIDVGQSTTLSWDTTGASGVQIDPGVGTVNASGSVTVSPRETTTYTLTATGPSGSTLRRLQIIVRAATGTAPFSTIVTVVSAPGLFGAFYRTNVQLNNPSGSPIYGRLIYHPKETSGSDSDPTLVYALYPGQTFDYRDVLTIIGVSGNGSLDVVADSGAQPLARARVFNDAGALGTTGVAEDARFAGDALVVGDVGVLLAPSDLRSFRFSIGLRTLSSGATLTFSLKDANGSQRATLTRSYPANYYVQQLAETFFDGVELKGNESVSVSVQAGSAFVYGTVADNTTNDPSIQFADRLP